MRQREGAYTTKQTTSGECYLHKLRERDPQQPPPPKRVEVRPAPNWSRLVEERCRETKDSQLQPHAEALGVSIASLRLLSCCCSPKFPSALLVPMASAEGKIRGIRVRHRDGRKRAVPGSREGCFIPDRVPFSRTLVVAEGFSDCAAGLDLAPDVDWIGRPSCSGGVGIVADYVRFHDPERVVVLADNDEPGQRGAASLAQTLRLIAPDVRVIVPPAPSKDLRAWVRAGAKREDLFALIENTAPLGRPNVEAANV